MNNFASAVSQSVGTPVSLLTLVLKVKIAVRYFRYSPTIIALDKKSHVDLRSSSS